VDRLVMHQHERHRKKIEAVYAFFSVSASPSSSSVNLLSVQYRSLTTVWAACSGLSSGGFPSTRTSCRSH
jgi:hypothetical protein